MTQLDLLDWLDATTPHNWRYQSSRLVSRTGDLADAEALFVDDSGLTKTLTFTVDVLGVNAALRIATKGLEIGEWLENELAIAEIAGVCRAGAELIRTTETVAARECVCCDDSFISSSTGNVVCPRCKEEHDGMDWRA